MRKIGSALVAVALALGCAAQAAAAPVDAEMQTDVRPAETPLQGSFGLVGSSQAVKDAQNFTVGSLFLCPTLDEACDYVGGKGSYEWELLKEGVDFVFGVSTLEQNKMSIASELKRLDRLYASGGLKGVFASLFPTRAVTDDWSWYALNFGPNTGVEAADCRERLGFNDNGELIKEYAKTPQRAVVCSPVEVSKEQYLELLNS